MTHALCESAHCSSPVAAGFGLCAECRQAVRRDLRALPELYDDCERRLASTSQGIIQRIRGTKPVGFSLNEAAMRARSNILDILSLWCALVVHERRVTGPSTRTAEALAAFLDRHLAWLAGHAAAGDFATEMRELAGTARDAASRDTRNSRRLGTCGRQDCGHIVYVSDAEDGHRPQVGCTAGHLWQPHEWISLSRCMRQAERAA
ncbi:hypothetical protein [Frankia sp. Cr1]|uniref:hypothetical protein n=1 Tax=Frankia sp. Cr1 TaxID=3073931 RepID=UPI002AD4B1CE|nr:hypothetical protein [Frankia sp. Cr1]